MPVLTLAITVALGIVLLLRKARFHYERLPKVPYVAGAQIPEVAIIPAAGSGAADYDASFPEDLLVSGSSVPPEADWILLLGEQTRYARVFLPSLTHYAVEEELEMVGVFLKQEPAGFVDRLLAPYALALLFAGVNSSRVNARPSAEPLSSGHCLLLQRRAYERLGSPAGGIDPALPVRAAEKGIRSRVVRAEHMGSVTGALAGFQNHTGSLFRRGLFSAVQSTLAAVLLLLWLPVLTLMILGAYYRQAALFALLPAVILVPWYRSAMTLLAPAAIYLLPLFSLKSKPAAREFHAAGNRLDETN